MTFEKPFRIQANRQTNNNEKLFRGIELTSLSLGDFQINILANKSKKRKTIDTFCGLMSNKKTNVMQTIEKVKKGECFRFPGKKTVYIKDGYNRELKKYSYYKFEDVNNFGHKKKGTQVETEFEF